MIGLDTNILVRYFMRDDEEQYEQARHLLEDVVSPQRPGFISLIALVEFVWVLSRTFRVDRNGIARAIALLLDSQDLKIERDEIVQHAYLDFVATRVDFADRLLSLVNEAENCEFTATFDSEAISRGIMKPIAAAG